MIKPDWIDEGYFATEKRDLTRIRWVLIVTMLLNFLATGVKLAAGLAIGSLSVVADGLDSLFDGVSNIVGLAGLYTASKPPDAQHPYGHRKYETIAALSISFLLFLTCWQILQTAWNRLGSGEFPAINLWTAGAMLLSMLIQVGTSIYELRQGKRLNSEILVADALHTRASVLVSASVLGGLGLVVAGFPQADALLAGLVALVIAKIGVDILRENLPVLVDQAALDPNRIAVIAKSVEGVESLHRVRSRGPVGSAAIDLHIQVSPRKSLQEATAVADEVRRRLLALNEVTDVTVHLEPYRQDDSDAGDIFAAIRQAAQELDLVIHEAWVYSIDGNLTTELHVGVKPALTLGEAHKLVDQLEKEIRLRLPQLRDVHTHIELASKDVRLSDHAGAETVAAVRREVERAVAKMPALSYPHNLIVRKERSGDERFFISLECTVRPDIPIGEAHDLASSLEGELHRRLQDVAEITVHLEPPDQD